MLVKFKKTLLFIICSFTLIFVCGSMVCVEAATTNPAVDVNCSKYLNILHNDYFMNKIVVSNLKMNPNYLIGTNYINKYDEIKAPEKMQKNNIGFKCNGVFYSDFVEINKTGKYEFKVYNYKVENGIKKAYGTSLETIVINVDIDDSLKQNKSNFYFEHYGDYSVLVDDIKNSFNLNVTISDYYIGQIKEAFNKYLTQKQETSENDISKFVDKKDFFLEVQFAGQIHKFTINLLSVTNPELQGSFVTDISEMTKNIPSLAFDVRKNPDLAGCYIESKLANYIDITKYLNYNEAQNIEITIKTNNTLIPSLNNSTNKFVIKNIIYQIKDYTTNMEEEYYRFFAFYNSNYINDSNINLKVKYNSNYKCQKNHNFSVNEYVDDVYFEIELDNKKYQDYYNVSNIELENSVNTSSLGVKTITLKIKDSSGKIYTDVSSYEIKDFFPPIILTQYDYIVVTRGSSDYLNQIKVIDNNKVDELKTTYKLEETSNSGGYMIIEAYDVEGLTTSITVPFVYKTELTVYQKTIGKLMYNWGKFLKKIF